MAKGETENHIPSFVQTPPDPSNEKGAREQAGYIGLLLKGRYLIEKEVGRGGVGIIYLARDQQLLSRRVVIKVLRDELVERDQRAWLQRKFQQEIEALALIDHPGVVGALDAGEMPDGKSYFVMQFIEGSNLRSLIKVQGMDLSRIAGIARQTAQALSAAHDKGVLHRDLKPENVMVQLLAEGEEYVKLIDFGIASIKDRRDAAGKGFTRIAGTIAYMAPEQLKGKPEAASDIYALGVMVYEMVTGHLPFNTLSAVDLYEKQQRGPDIRPGQHRYSLPEAAEEVMLKAMSFNPADRYRRARDFGEALVRSLTGSSESGTYSLSSTKQLYTPRHQDADTVLSVQNQITEVAFQIAILYKRNAEPDGEILKLLEEALLAHGHRVFIDRHLAVGVEWAREIERQVRTSDAVIPLVSAASVTSEMLAYEVQIAYDAAQKQHGVPRLLPIRINYEGPLPYPLGGILDSIQYSLWTGPKDNERVVKDMLASLRIPPDSTPNIIPQKLEAVGGAVPLESEFYIERSTDDEFHLAIDRNDSIVLVKGARQMGKTSLLARGLQRAREAGARVVLTDFQMLNSVHMETVETLLFTLAELIADQLDLDVLPGEVWNARRGPSINFRRYIQREVLDKIEGHLVWGLDEVDRLFSCDYGSEVFGLFRSWHNARSLDPAGPWRRLTLAIAYATEAHLFIKDVNQSPFNVGTRVMLEDFTSDQVSELNRRYGSPLRDTAEVARFHRMVSGHPYLVRRGLHELATHSDDLNTFEYYADRDEGPFGDHLRRILVLLAQDQTLCEVVRGLLQGRACPDAESFYRLRSAGIATGDSAREARLRCQLYVTYLASHLL